MFLIFFLAFKIRISLMHKMSVHLRRKGGKIKAQWSHTLGAWRCEWWAKRGAVDIADPKVGGDERTMAFSKLFKQKRLFRLLAPSTFSFKCTTILKENTLIPSRFYGKGQSTQYLII